MTELVLSEGVALAHALVARVAADDDVRVLFIKGPTAVLQGLRAPRESVDVDALVDPARRERLAARLTELGWVDENPYTSPTVLPMHSLTHRHPAWPCELDLHDRQKSLTKQISTSGMYTVPRSPLTTTRSTFLVTIVASRVDVCVL